MQVVLTFYGNDIYIVCSVHLTKCDVHAMQVICCRVHHAHFVLCSRCFRAVHKRWCIAVCGAVSAILCTGTGVWHSMYCKTQEISSTWVYMLFVCSCCVHKLSLLFGSGRRKLLQCLLSVSQVLNSSEPYYIMNILYITDYCIWIQRARYSHT